MNRSKLYLVVQTVLCVALAALLVASALSIYREGAARRALFTRNTGGREPVVR